MFECDSCATEVRFVDANGDGVTCGCADGNPQERAAIALYATSRGAMGWPSWDAPALDSTIVREAFRQQADLALRAAIDLEELARLLPEITGLVSVEDAPQIAKAITTHYLGTETP